MSPQVDWSSGQKRWPRSESKVVSTSADGTTVYPRNILLAAVPFSLAVAAAVVCWLNIGRGPTGEKVAILVVAILTTVYLAGFVAGTLIAIRTTRRWRHIADEATAEVRKRQSS